MTYSRPFVKIRVQGVFGAAANTPIEQWSWGFNISSLGGGSFDPANLLTFLGNIAPHTSTFHSSIAMQVGNTAWLTKLTAAYIGTDGLYVLGSLQPTTVYTYGTAVAGSGSPIHPLATSQVCTLKSLRLRGPASHGRMYIPALAVTLNTSDGTIPSGNLAGRSGAAKTWIDLVNNSAGAAFGSGSKVSLVSKVATGAESIVVAVAFDQKLDHMESRERSQVSSYSTAVPAVAAAAIAERDEDLRRQFDELEDQEPAV